METINVKAVEIIGRCPAGLTLGDVFQIEGMNLQNPEENPICFLAFSQIPLMVWQLQSERRFFSHASCPGCISQLDQENRVVFLLGHADKWELCQSISEYLRLSKRCKEPEAAKQLKEKAIQHQGREEYAQAAQKMEVALKELRRAVPFGKTG